MKRRAAALLLSLVLILGQFSNIEAAPEETAEAAKEIGQDMISDTPDPEQEYKEDEVIIVYEDEMVDTDRVENAIGTSRVRSLGETEQALAELGIVDQEEIVSSGGVSEGAVAVAQLPEDISVDEAIQELEDTEDVAYVQKNYIYRLQASTNDSMKKYAYHLDNMNLEEAWNLSRADSSSYNNSGKPVTVAVLDTGINYDKSERHEELHDVNAGGNILYSYAYDAEQGKKMSKKGTDWYDPTGTYTDYIGHGTWVASVIAARANNKKGTAGTSYNGRVLPVNVFEQPVFSDDSQLSKNLYAADSGATSAALIAGYDYVLKYAKSLNIKVVNMSLGGYISDIDQALQDSVDEAYEKGILTVAAAGNYGSSKKMYPASFDHVISVASVDNMNKHSSFSQHNDAVDVSASGESILVPAAGYVYNSQNDRLYWYKNTGYMNKEADDKDFSISYASMDIDGTSFSSPAVAGIAALLYAADPEMTPDKAEQCLKETATDKGAEGYDNYYGYGVVDAYKAVALALGEEADSTVSETESAAVRFAKLSLTRPISSASLSTTTYTYNGKVKRPSVTVKYSGRTIASKSTKSTLNVKLSYSSGRKKVGTYKVKVTGQNTFSGTITKTFKIIPKTTSIKSVSKKRKGFTVKWKTQKTQTTGYQIRYSTKSSMSGAKTKTISKNTSTSKTITGLKAKKKYYVQIRTYKTVKGKKYYSKWSSKKSVKTR